jgi:tripartite-type tricarboxylate transporter receptor subunit TctC
MAAINRNVRCYPRKQTFDAGKAKMLAIGSLKRPPEIPEVPTTAETVPG